MRSRRVLVELACLALVATSLLAFGPRASAQEPRQLILPGQRHLDIRDPAQLPHVRIPDLPAPPTVSESHDQDPKWELSLDDAVRAALLSADVVRTVAGNIAVSTGQTIYDPAITNTAIDQQRAAFDPQLNNRTTFARRNNLLGLPNGLIDDGVQGYESTSSLSKKFIPGGTLGLELGVDGNRSRFPFRDPQWGIMGPTSAAGLDPANASNLGLRAEQPLLKGAGSTANLAPILVARINTERSFFQMKDAVQDLVLSVIQTYWSLFLAQTEVWARERQVEGGREQWELRKAWHEEQGWRKTTTAEVAQAEASYENFQAALIAARANVLNQEAVLRNLLGLPPSDPHRIVPVTPLNTERLPNKWEQLLQLAEQYRPDVIELKLVLEADQQQLLLSRNQALPQLNLNGLYRWNGLEGVAPNGAIITSEPGQFTSWEAGVNFSVPLGLRKERAAIRDWELMIMRDRINLDQSLHSASHQLAVAYRNLAQFYEQYQAYSRVRRAAKTTWDGRKVEQQQGRPVLYVDVLLAITDWGNAVNSECQALAQYNTELARLERQTGTILESHGVRFYEERYGSVGPLGRLFENWCYPQDTRPTANADSLPAPAEHQYRLPSAVRLPAVDGDAAAEPLPPPRRETPAVRAAR